MFLLIKNSVTSRLTLARVKSSVAHFPNLSGSHSTRSYSGSPLRIQSAMYFPAPPPWMIPYLEVYRSGLRIQGGPSASGKEYVDNRLEVAFSCKFIL